MELPCFLQHEPCLEKLVVTQPHIVVEAFLEAKLFNLTGSKQFGMLLRKLDKPGADIQSPEWREFEA